MGTSIITLRSLRLFVSTNSWGFSKTQIPPFPVRGFWWSQKYFSSVHVTLRTTFSGLGCSRSQRQNFIRCFFWVSVKGCKHLGERNFFLLFNKDKDLSLKFSIKLCLKYPPVRDDSLAKFFLICAMKFEISSIFSRYLLIGAGVFIRAFRWMVVPDQFAANIWWRKAFSKGPDNELLLFFGEFRHFLEASGLGYFSDLSQFWFLNFKFHC